jgi:hypothetical protein
MTEQSATERLRDGQAIAPTPYDNEIIELLHSADQV